jgi:hypothetical protein
MRARLLMLALAALLAACGEKPQALERNSKDAPAYSGTGKAFVNGGWTPGDKASWTAQLKARQQYGQNDYSRMN